MLLSACWQKQTSPSSIPAIWLLLEKKSKATYYLLGNKATSHLTKSIKQRCLKTKIASVNLPLSKTTVVNPFKCIVNAFSEFYQSLYDLKDNLTIPQPIPSAIQNFLKSINLPTLTTSQTQTLSEPFTPSEIELAIKTLPLNKSPGGDGYTNEYYKQFTSILSPHLADLFNHVESSGSLPKEMLQSVITTIPKLGKDTQLVQNYRLISLINTYVKQYAKVIADCSPFYPPWYTLTR